MIKTALNAAFAAGFAATLALTAGVVPANAQTATATKTIYVYADQAGLMGTDKKHHDAFFPADFVLKAGQKVTLVFVNYDDAPHSFTAPGLHLNVVIKAGHDKTGSDGVTPTTTTFTFTPATAGEFKWHCVMPCDTYSMNRQGYMAGYVKVI